jgi:5-(carboxyamino)imidazole ribonucleotide synthase
MQAYGRAWNITIKNHNLMDIYQPPAIAILGGGQLGRMLIRELIPYAPKIFVADPDPEAPCKALAERFLCCSLYDEEQLFAFCSEADVVTIEIEHVSVNLLRRLKAAGKKVVPDPEVLWMVQDKGRQKAFFQEIGVPTMPFVLIDKKSDCTPDKAPFRAFAQKTRTGGYDGKGVQLIRSEADWLQKAWDVPSVLEDLAELKTELAVMVASDFEGKMRQWPAVEMEFHPEANLVTLLFCPSAQPPHVLKQAEAIADKLAQALGLTGLLAIEFFVTKDDQVWVNEIAPRPHNSGHHTMEACATGQFAQLARILCGFALGETELRKPVVMINLLGPEGMSGEAIYPGIHELMGMKDVYVHLYGKKQTKPGRKMGHCTILDEDLERAMERARGMGGGHL